MLTQGLGALRASRNSRSTVTSESFANPLYESSNETSPKDNTPELTSPETEKKKLPVVKDSADSTTDVPASTTEERVSRFGNLGNANDLLERGTSLDEEDPRPESITSQNMMKYYKKMNSEDSGDLLSLRTQDNPSPAEPEALPLPVDEPDAPKELPVGEPCSTDAQNPSESPKPSKPEDPIVLNYFHVEETFDMSAWILKYRSKQMHQNAILSLHDEIKRLGQSLTMHSLSEKDLVPSSENEIQLFPKSPAPAPSYVEEIEFLVKEVSFLTPRSLYQCHFSVSTFSI